VVLQFAVVVLLPRTLIQDPHDKIAPPNKQFLDERLEREKREGRKEGSGELVG
jgi:hypothetical protein